MASVPSHPSIVTRVLTAADGTALHTVFQPTQREIARVIITHGMGEHGGRYPHVMAGFSERGISCAVHDLRGHGRSGGTRGRIRKYGDFLTDLQLVVESYRRPELPTFLYGHSLGGQITINFLARSAPGIAGAVIASPWLSLAFRPPIWKSLVAMLATRIWPGFIQKSPGLQDKLSRDGEWLTALRNAELSHRNMSAGLFSALVQGGRRALASAKDLSTPIMLMHGEEDSVTCKNKTREFFRDLKSPDKTLRLWPGMRHETHNEVGREEVIALTGDWILKRSQVEPGSTTLLPPTPASDGSERSLRPR